MSQDEIKPRSPGKLTPQQLSEAAKIGSGSGNVLVAQKTEIRTSHQGPIPSPQVLEGYEKILPGAAERIMQMAEREQAHRHSKDTFSLKIESKGQWMAFSLAGLGIIVGAGLIYAGKDISGLIALLTPLGAIIGLFVWQQKRASAGAKKSAEN